MRDMPPIDLDADSLGPPLGPGLGSCRAALLADGSVLRAWCHAANVGRIALALAEHDIGDMDDCSINDPIVSIIDGGEPAHVPLQALADMSEETAAGICKQL
jgi:hypothetical protein